MNAARFATHDGCGGYARTLRSYLSDLVLIYTVSRNEIHLSALELSRDARYTRARARALETDISIALTIG